METILAPVANLSCKEKFTISHFLSSSHLSCIANKKVYGSCSNWEEHSHNYTIDVITRGKISNEIGTIMSLSEMKDIVRRVVINKLNGKDLNSEIEYFKTVPSTIENLAVYIWSILKHGMSSPELLHEVKLMDDEGNSVIYNGCSGYAPKKGQITLTSDTD